MRIPWHIWPLVWNVAAVIFALTGNFVAGFACAMVAQISIEFN